MDFMIKIMMIVLVISFIFSAVGWFLNYRVQQRANQLVVARRYNEASQILSDEQQIRIQIIDLFKRRKSKDRQELTGLAKTTVDDQNKRIEQINSQQKEIENKFSFLDKEAPADVEKWLMLAQNNKRDAQLILQRFESTE